MAGFDSNDPKSGAVYYDADGTGSARAVKIAVLAGSPDDVNRFDFLVIA